MWRYLLGYRRDREELFKVFRRWYCLEAAFVLAWQILDFPFPGYFIRIPFPRHDHVFTQCYTDYFTANMAEMLTHARAKGTRPLFPPPLRGLGTRLGEKSKSRIGYHRKRLRIMSYTPSVDPLYYVTLRNAKSLSCY